MVSRFPFFVASRLVNAIISIIFMIALIFALSRIIAPTPLDLARLYSGSHATNPTVLLSIAKRLGHTQPVYVQIYN